MSDILSLRSIVAEKIAASILSGEFEPGAQLKEAALAERLGVSRAPVREALRLLEERRLVESHPYSGARVTVFTPEDVADLYELREVLEARAAYKAAMRATEEDIAELKAIIDQEATQISGEAVEATGDEPNIDFHQKIIQISGNREFARLMNNDFWRYNRILYRMHWGRKEGRDEERHIEHVRIFEAIQSGDGPLAELLMRRHVQSTRVVIGEARQVRYGRRASDKV
ncbi:GntR family transcriptional regulator [Microvirga sp. VF16]|uniref:GntR family transcriptional regulator n=1 Tax=Microvirga sp. VF16 TaxID=2807101 RepID=UPI00193D789F|nr:GntR family transcriptional regulator [Microvirga sp. VF16]QRM34954.1 GntR family transcriptional regulator [Microvirga sp. VF16]